MNVTFTILAVLVVIASILLTLIVLLQNGKGGGLASNFTAGNQTFGVRQTTDLLEKITWGLVVFILVISIVSTCLIGNRNENHSSNAQIENVLPGEIETSGAEAAEPVEATEATEATETPEN